MKDFRTYTIKQAAERLQMAESTIRTYIKEGKLKAARFGTRVRISQQHLEEFFNEHVVNGEEVNLDDNEESEETQT